MTGIFKTSDVFGIGRDLPLNYVERELVDGLLLDSLSRSKHITIYGSSKQGKTSLRKKCLRDVPHIVIHCSNKWTVAELHTAILKQAGYEVTQSTARAASGTFKLIATLKAKVFGLSAAGTAEGALSRQTTTVTAPLELDPEDVNDIKTALEGLDAYIVLEDFHYLPIDTQRDFAIALKAFHEQSKLCFIIVGVWLEDSRLTVHNGDLTGRVISVNADKWLHEELTAVIELGEKLLNIEFTKEFRVKLIESCLNSVYILQETCYSACKLSGVVETQSTLQKIGDELNVKEVVREVVNQQSARYHKFLARFSESQTDGKAPMSRWVLMPILMSPTSELGRGLTLSHIQDVLKRNHPQRKGFDQRVLAETLDSIAAFQVSKSITPIILDYDQTSQVLNVVDLGFLIWLDHNPGRTQLFGSVKLPDPIYATGYVPIGAEVQDGKPH
jgi:hypothetical protein